MIWDDVRYEARHVASQLEWECTHTHEPLFLERLVRRAFKLPTPFAAARQDSTARPVLVVPTRWTATTPEPGAHRFQAEEPGALGWAIRLTRTGQLEYLRWRAAGPPDWEADQPFAPTDLTGCTAADHWAAVDDSQLAKTDLDWSWQHQVPREDGVTEYAVSPRASGSAPGTALRRALQALLLANHPDTAPVINLRRPDNSRQHA